MKKQLKLVLPIIICGSFCHFPTSAQEYNDPFMGNYILGNSAELFLMNADQITETTLDYVEHSKVMLDFDTDGKLKSDIFAEENLIDYWKIRWIQELYSMDAVGGNFNVNPYGYDEVAIVYSGVDRVGDRFSKVEIWYKDKYSKDFRTHNIKILQDAPSLMRQCKIIKAQLDDDPFDEIVVCGQYDGNPDATFIYCIDIDNSLNAEMLYSDYFFMPLNWESTVYDICADDFDNDKIDEIVWIENQCRPRADTFATWGVYEFEVIFEIGVIDINKSYEGYDYETKKYDSFLIRGETAHPISSPREQFLSLPSISLVSGDIDRDDCNELVVGFELTYTACTGSIWLCEYKWNSSRHLIPVEISDKNGWMESPLYADRVVRINDYSVGNYSENLWIFKTPTTLWCGDLDDDSYDNEIVFQSAEALHFGRLLPDISSPEPGNFNWNETASIIQNPKLYVWPEDVFYSLQTMSFDYHSFVIDDINANENTGEWRPEITVIDYENTFNEQLSGNHAGRMRLRTYANNISSDEWRPPSLIHESFLNEDQGNRTAKHSIVLKGDFDGDGIRLGPPRRISLSSVMEPVFIINAPPVHFDILNNKVYDVCNSFNDNENNFTVILGKEDSHKEELTTKFHESWSISSGLKADVKGGFISSKLTAKYGRNFSKVASESTQTTIGVTARINGDGLIVASVSDYEFLEYPVYAKNTFSGTVLVTKPHYKGLVWFPMKNERAESYIPNHEYGNLFSYDDDLLDNADIVYRLDNSDHTFTLDAYNPSIIDWKLDRDKLSSERLNYESVFSTEFSSSLKVPLKILDVGLELSGAYSRGDITTRTSSVSEKLEIDIHFDELNQNLGNIIYEVTPYVYNTYNGAFVLDYLVNIDPTASENCWWAQQNLYGQYPDLAFILPWRYDIEKGKMTTNETLKYKTKDIQFYPKKAEPGDTVRIEARIHNFSMQAFEDIVTLKFYIGDPDKGGHLISGIEGETEWSEGVLLDYKNEAPYQKNITAIFSWIVPYDIPKDPDIYVVVDPENTVNEIHKNNNKGYNTLKVDGVTPTYIAEMPYSSISNVGNYPNPFNDYTTIYFEMNEAGTASIEVLNMMGQKVRTVTYDNLEAGKHEVEFRSLDLRAGIYVYQITANHQKVVSKMTISK